MNALIVALFVSVFAVEYLVHELRIASQYVALVPELLSGIAILVLLKYLFAGRQWALDWRYGLFLPLYLFVVVFGFLAQSMPSGAIVSGMRTYLKFLPFFLLPAVYPFTKRQLGVQLAAILTVLAVQSPLAVYQRFVQYADKMHSGDPVSGFATTSGVLSVLMMGAVAVVVSMYLRRMIGFALMLFLTALYVLPTTLNETKVTLFLLPVAMFMPAFLMPRGSGVWRRLMPLAVVASVALVAFVSMYNYLIVNSKYGSTIETFLTEGDARRYLYTGAAEGEARVIGRFDSIVIAVRRLSDDPLAFAFGLGAGNVSLAPLRGFDGEYAAYFTRYGVDQTQITRFMWEIGLVGIALFLWFCFLIFRDSRALAREPEGEGFLGQVWATVVVIVVMTLLYVSIFAINEIAYFFWFYSGVVASALVRSKRAARQRQTAPAPVPRWAAGASDAETVPAR